MLKHSKSSLQLHHNDRCSSDETTYSILTKVIADQTSYTIQVLGVWSAFTIWEWIHVEGSDYSPCNDMLISVVDFLESWTDGMAVQWFGWMEEEITFWVPAAGTFTVCALELLGSILELWGAAGESVP